MYLSYGNAGTSSGEMNQKPNSYRENVGNDPVIS